MDNNIITQAEETCRKLKESIDFVNREISKLEGQKTVVSEQLENLTKECAALGVKPEELSSVIEQGISKLAEVTEEAQGFIDKIAELRGK